MSRGETVQSVQGELNLPVALFPVQCVLVAIIISCCLVMKNQNEDTRRNDSHVGSYVQLLETQKLWFKFIGNLGKIWGLFHSLCQCLPRSVVNDLLSGFSLLSFQSVVGAEKLKGVKDRCLLFSSSLLFWCLVCYFLSFLS